jgi:hypothetical protein
LATALDQIHGEIGQIVAAERDKRLADLSKAERAARTATEKAISEYVAARDAQGEVESLVGWLSSDRGYRPRVVKIGDKTLTGVIHDLRRDATGEGDPMVQRRSTEAIQP